MSANHTPFAPFLDAAPRFAAAAQQYFEDCSHGGDTASSAAQTLGNFLRDQAGAWFTPPAPAPPLEMPALGLTREHQQRAQRAADAARRAVDAQRRLQVFWFDALRDAATAFVSRIGAPPSVTSEAPELGTAFIRGLYDCWIDCAEVAYAVIVRSEAFCDALADLVNAGSQWRAESVAALEHAARALDLPTRSELNSLLRRLAAVEEQLRLEREPHAAAVPLAVTRRRSRTRRAPPA